MPAWGTEAPGPLPEHGLLCGFCYKTLYFHLEENCHNKGTDLMYAVIVTSLLEPPGDTLWRVEVGGGEASPRPELRADVSCWPPAGT